MLLWAAYQTPTFPRAFANPSAVRLSASTSTTDSDLQAQVSKGLLVIWQCSIIKFLFLFCTPFLSCTKDYCVDLFFAVRLAQQYFNLQSLFCLDRIVFPFMFRV